MSRTCPEALLLIDETFQEAGYGFLAAFVGKADGISRSGARIIIIAGPSRGHC